MNYDESLKNISQLCLGLSEAQRRIIESASMSALQQAANCFSSSTRISQSLRNSVSAMNEIIKQNMSQYAVESLNQVAPMEEIQKVMRDQISAIEIMERSASTLMLESFASCTNECELYSDV